jgi:hypothetical protein
MKLLSEVEQVEVVPLRSQKGLVGLVDPEEEGMDVVVIIMVVQIALDLGH